MTKEKSVLLKYTKVLWTVLGVRQNLASKIVRGTFFIQLFAGKGVKKLKFVSWYWLLVGALFFVFFIVPLLNYLREKWRASWRSAAPPELEEWRAERGAALDAKLRRESPPPLKVDDRDEWELLDEALFGPKKGGRKRPS